MKKIISLILCLMMVLAVASPVFAEERTNHTHTITIGNDNHCCWFATCFETYLF